MQRVTKPRILVVVTLCLVLGAVGLASAGVRTGAKSTAPVKGGTLTLLGQSDIFNLDTTSGYYTVDNILERSFTPRSSRRSSSSPTSPRRCPRKGTAASARTAARTRSTSRRA
jgi:hypothetical protein